MYINELKELLGARIALLSKILEYTQNKLSNMPSGSLRIQRQGKYVSYHHVPEKEQSNGILLKNEDGNLIRELAQKSYLKKVSNSVQKELRHIRNFLDKYPEETFDKIYDQLSSDRRELVKPVTLSDEQFTEQWLNKPYDHKGFSEGEPFYMTQNGERVRSKSEQIIADHLKARGIPYKYECPLKLKNKTVYPDFTILRLSDRKEIYYEHLGKMGDQNYADKNIMKMNEYALSGYLQGRDIFTTMETQQKPLDARVLDKMIDDLFM